MSGGTPTRLSTDLRAAVERFMALQRQPLLDTDDGANTVRLIVRAAVAQYHKENNE